MMTSSRGKVTLVWQWRTVHGVTVPVVSSPSLVSTTRFPMIHEEGGKVSIRQSGYELSENAQAWCDPKGWWWLSILAVVEWSLHKGTSGKEAGKRTHSTSESES